MDKPYKYTKNSRAKHYRITIKSDHVRVTIPKWGSQKKAESFVATKQEWINKSFNKLVQEQRDYSYFSIEELRSEAHDYIPPRVKLLAKKYGFVFNAIRIKNIRTRWGSCSSRKNLNFSLHLMKLEPHFIDYVILHELAHTVEMNHGPRFWSLLESVYPGAKAIDRDMKSFNNLM